MIDEKTTVSELWRVFDKSHMDKLEWFAHIIQVLSIPEEPIFCRGTYFNTAAENNGFKAAVHDLGTVHDGECVLITPNIIATHTYMTHTEAPELYDALLTDLNEHLVTQYEDTKQQYLDTWTQRHEREQAAAQRKLEKDRKTEDAARKKQNAERLKAANGKDKPTRKATHGKTNAQKRQKAKTASEKPIKLEDVKDEKRREALAKLRGIDPKEVRKFAKEVKENDDTDSTDTAHNDVSKTDSAGSA